ncbi:EpsG family protein [Halomonas ramblicola]|uniref:EpsG family protein n=1 Tax=Halomonas ramblicola TaxID=747349 RepID=UPI0025B4ED09|nr:EpsG family protein [Halomonas ramblicola]MDN3522056.1 EpsG family protein [Halomonas ramblicola]
MLLPRDDWRIERASAWQETPILPPSRLFLIAAILLISIVVSSFVANRPLHIGADADGYISVFNSLNYGHYTRISEPLFVGLALAVGSLTGNYKFFFFACSLILFFSSLYANHRLINRVVMTPYRGRYITYLAFGLLLYSPFYFNMHVNILRHGMAVPFLLLGYLMVMEKRYPSAALLLLASLGFHASSLIHILLVPLLFLNLRILVGLFLAFSAIYLANLSSAVLGPIFAFLNMASSFETISEYGASSGHRSGVRFDFWLFTTFFVGLSVMAAWRNVVAEALPRVMVTSSIPFLLFGYISFSDRLLVFSWFIIAAIVACCSSWILMNIERNFLFVVAVLLNLVAMGMFIGKLF